MRSAAVRPWGAADAMNDTAARPAASRMRFIEVPRESAGILSGDGDCPWPDEAEDARVAVHEGRALHGRDLAGAEHARHRDVDHAPQRAGIVAAHAEHIAAAPHAGEEDRRGRRRAAREGSREPLLELVRSGLAV